ncbi:MAG TPA: NADH-quinone oxidoreductase subunit C [Casimicrobiaceae bacterium]|nr:NADH-quinone oxidoreductase subunit C [Casimicrobiaceae bacterium]
MNLSALGLTPAMVPASVPARRYSVDAMQLLAAARVAWEQGGQLVALWVSDDRDRERGLTLRVALRDVDGLTVLEHALAEPDAQYPDLSAIFPSANRMQRAAFDLTGAQSAGDDQRPWLWQASWPVDEFPLRRDFAASPKWQPGVEDYEFVRVEGVGVHEIAVGPVHAGIIEPGHFRFQVVGEKVLRLEERLGYVHKGIEKRFESMSLLDGYRLAGRVSGDSTVAYALAYAQAAEAITSSVVPPRAQWLRALMLERERLANHLGDLGYLGNDGGFAFGLAQFSRLREDVLRVNATAFGHRLLMDKVIPGGVARDLDSDAARAMAAQCASLDREIRVLRDIYDDHAGLQDRFRTCGIVTSTLAKSLGMAGMAARASGSTADLRHDFALPPYDQLEVRVAGATTGDVAARVAVRFDEALESLRLTGLVLDAMPQGDIAAPLRDAPAHRLALGWVEGWRGPVLLALETGPDNTIRRCHPHDVSWENWPAIEHAVIGNIVPDFPLINKSFNLSYSGHDL